MSKLTKQNVGGIDYTMVGCTLTGVCASGAADYIKVVTLSDGDAIGDGMTVVVAFTNGNTAGTAPMPTTIYSSDQVNYYADDQLTVPFTLAPTGCYEIEYTGEGNAYSYVSYPIMQVGSVSGPLCDASGNKASGALWLAGDKVSVNYSNGCFNVIPQATDSMTVMTASSVVNGAPLRTGSTVRVMLTADLAGTDTATGLVLSYNGINTPVKVGKNGSLSNFVASEVSSGVYKYVQAYTTLELMFDGTQFIIIGNPVVLSSADYTIYADGLQRVDTVATNNKNMVTSNAVATELGKQYDDSYLNNITDVVIKSLGVTDVKAYRKQNFVFIYITGTYTGVQTTSTQVCVSNLPAKYRPRIEQSGAVVSYKNENQPYVFSARILIESNGNVALAECGFPTGAQMRMGFIYMV